MRITRLGLWGHNTRPAGSFAGKTPFTPSAHPVGKITRMGMWGHNTRRVTFTAKTANTVEPSPVSAGLIRFGSDAGKMMNP